MVRVSINLWAVLLVYLFAIAGISLLGGTFFISGGPSDWPCSAALG